MGCLWMPDEAFGTAFCQHASPEQAALFAATQRPIALACIQEKAPRPAWKTTPSWYLIAQEDRMINPATQLFSVRTQGGPNSDRKGSTIRHWLPRQNWSSKSFSHAVTSFGTSPKYLEAEFAVA